MQAGRVVSDERVHLDQCCSHSRGRSSVPSSSGKLRTSTRSLSSQDVSRSLRSIYPQLSISKKSLPRVRGAVRFVVSYTVFLRRENSKLEREIILPTPTRANTFAVPLKDLMGYDGEKDGIPRVIKDSIQYLRETGMCFPPFLSLDRGVLWVCRSRGGVVPEVTKPRVTQPSNGCLRPR